MIKQETPEEAAERLFPLLEEIDIYTYEENLHLISHRKTFIQGVKNQQEISYSEKEVIEILRKSRYAEFGIDDLEKWFEKFKKK